MSDDRIQERMERIARTRDQMLEREVIDTRQIAEEACEIWLHEREVLGWSGKRAADVPELQGRLAAIARTQDQLLEREVVDLEAVTAASVLAYMDERQRVQAEPIDESAQPATDFAGMATAYAAMAPMQTEAMLAALAPPAEEPEVWGEFGRDVLGVIAGASVSVVFLFLTTSTSHRVGDALRLLRDAATSFADRQFLLGAAAVIILAAILVYFLFVNPTWWRKTRHVVGAVMGGALCAVAAFAMFEGSRSTMRRPLALAQERLTEFAIDALENRSRTGSFDWPRTEYGFVSVSPAEVTPKFAIYEASLANSDLLMVASIHPERAEVGLQRPDGETERRAELLVGTITAITPDQFSLRSNRITRSIKRRQDITVPATGTLVVIELDAGRSLSRIVELSSASKRAVAAEHSPDR